MTFLEELSIDYFESEKKKNSLKTFSTNIYSNSRDSLSMQKKKNVNYYIVNEINKNKLFMQTAKVSARKKAANR